MPIRSHLQPGAFEPEVIAAMSEALEAALNELRGAGRFEVAPEALAGQLLQPQRLVSVIRFACGQRRLLGGQANETSTIRSV